MVQLQILSGNGTGTKFCGSQFPIRAGRAKDSDVMLAEPGIWPRHFQITWETEGIIIEAEPDALMSVNDKGVRRAVLRNGDIITVGAVKIRFSLGPVRQSSMALRETLTWVALGALCLWQVALVYILLR
ncbi:MAG TPA: FHA domain-containing protein [Verrucomicrobiae bacterium]|jgi:pSer/pThr/pTyr-binding forkhead associated (FHA) protein|nr:FHA domain-containing protein [Verrucomicrobiae bacterium]